MVHLDKAAFRVYKQSQIEVIEGVAFIHCGGKEKLKAVIDASSAEIVSGMAWNIWKTNGKTYVGSRVYLKSGSKVFWLHRLLLSAPAQLDVDHINGNPLDNRLSNLRLATHSQNMANCKMLSTNKSGFVGVSWNKKKTCWQANIWANGRSWNLGHFSNPEAAARAYDDVAVKLRGDFARTNSSRGLLRMEASL